MPVPRFGQNLRLHQSPGCLPLFAGTLKNCDLPCAGMDCPDRVRASRVARERRVFWRGAMGKNQPGKLIALVWIAYRDSFVLKGALLFELWTKDRHRPTRDVDFLAYGPNDLERFIAYLGNIRIPVCWISSARVSDATARSLDAWRFDQNFGVILNYLARRRLCRR
jgi:hypothetical protein